MKYSRPNKATPSPNKMNMGGRTLDSTRVKKETGQSQATTVEYACKEEKKKDKINGKKQNVMAGAPSTCNPANAREVGLRLNRLHRI